MTDFYHHITRFFRNNNEFQWLVENNRDYPQANKRLIEYFNPARPSLIQVIGEQEANYINSLSSYAQWQQLEQLKVQNVHFLVFAHNAEIPKVFTRQQAINLLKTSLLDKQVINLVGNAFSCQYNLTEIVQGGLLVIENQGILITGKTGAGKSQLLISLLDRGHHWVSDELTHCYIDHNGQVMGKALDELASFTHIKHIGPIDIDKTFGLSKRLQQYALAGIIHLGENNTSVNQQVPLYEQKLSRTILGQTFPEWQLGPGVNNLEVVIETCARQLILEQWGHQAANELEKELEKTLCETT